MKMHLYVAVSLFMYILLGDLSIAGEVAKGADIHVPLIHQTYYKGERELLGYSPKYKPNIVSFDDKNTPYIRTEDGCVQVLNKTGKWVEIDFKAAIKAAYPKWNGKLKSGPFAEERIVFDGQGDAYMHVKISRGKPDAQSLIMYSHDQCRTWSIHPLPKKFVNGWWVKLETTPPFRRSPSPPTLSLFNGNSLYIMIPQKTKSGLKLPVPSLISKSVFASPTHSGGGNFTATIHGKSFVVYASSIPKPGKTGTSQYITVFDHRSKRCSPPIFMGNNGHNKPDPHNIPSILLDSKGYIHVFLGSHADPFVYLRSITPHETSKWTTPIKLGYPKTKMAEGSYTYIGVLCDAFDNLHLSARWSGAGYKNKLVYMRKPAGKSWLEQITLVEPFKALYSVFYHKMSQDLYGRIFINYSYYGNELDAAQVAAYDKKWPEDNVTKGERPEKVFLNGHWYKKVKNHDPVMILTNDSGRTFRLALTADFAGGVISTRNSEIVEKNSIGMTFVGIPSGSFLMGSLNGAVDERPLKPISIEKNFLLGQVPVRVKDFAEFVEATGYKTVFEKTTDKKLIHNWCGGKFHGGDDRTWRNPGIKQTPNDPVVMITIDDVKEFIRWISKKENAVYRLPTEAEWEYACRAGSIKSYYFGNDESSLPKYAWYKSNSTGTKPVGSLLPNTWGLHDMSGNVWEYCEDYYTASGSDMPTINPCERKKSVSGHVIRGGSWIDDSHGEGNGFNLRSASRYHMVYPLMQVDWVGFRVVKERVRK